MRRARRRRALALAAAVASAVLAVWLAFFSPLLAVRSVRVTGARHTPASDVADAAGVVGDNLLLLSPSDVERRVRALPWVADARATRRLPATVVVRVRERRPAAVLTRGAEATVDARGRVLTSGARPGLPAIVGAAPARQPVPGESVSDPAACAGLRVLRSLPPGLERETRAVLAPAPARISLALSDGVVVRLGTARRLDAKVAVLRALRAEARRTGEAPSYIDVRVPESPALGHAPADPPDAGAEDPAAP